MDVCQRTATSLAGRLMTQLNAWPAVHVGLADCGVGTGFFSTAGVQIVHLHGDGEAHLRLTRPVIARLGDALIRSGRVIVTPDAEWVRVRLDTESDVALAMSLASVAIKAHGHH